MELVLKYFSGLTSQQIKQFEALYNLYEEWNSKINVISRKDIESLYERHVLHSLGIAKVIQFSDNSNILDVGTGGGFPGVPLAILFPNCQFHLVDSINKKLKVINAVSSAIGLNNIKTSHLRAEHVEGCYDFVVSRAVTRMPVFVSWINEKIKRQQNNAIDNGVLYLKGGDLSKELSTFSDFKIYELSEYFNEEFFETKKVVHLPIAP